AQQRIDARYVLDIAEIPTFQIMRERSSTGVLDRTGLARWAQSEIAGVQAGLQLEADGRRITLQPDAPRVSTRPGAGGLRTLYWSTDFHAYVAAAHVRHLRVVDSTFPDRIGWKDIVVEPAVEPTEELRHYPNALLASPRDVTSADIAMNAGRIEVTYGSRNSVSNAAGPVTSQVRSNTLSDMLSRGTGNPLFVLLTLVIAIGLGALHALEPGHGKTLLAVSLVGARATARQALLLAVALTFAHTIGVIALGLVLLFAAQWIVPESVYPWITVFSGFFVASLGANALGRFISARRGANHQHHDHEHSHGRTEHEHHHHGHQHTIRGSAPLSFRSVVLIAMSGNIAPCPAALVVLLSALSLHRLGYGLIVVIAFSIGLAAVLTGMGIAFVRGASWLSERAAFDRMVKYGPLVSACVIAFIGAAMIGQGFASSPLQAPALLVTVLALGAVAGYALRPGHIHVRPGRPHAVAD
ncbi:MAG: hypothetical protein M3007_03875, partial [Candidatus Eremiobacteraeota bacterium]|nr:hypothetical protein [Candidatus Eremiobacteraeota bacterium]